MCRECPLPVAGYLHGPEYLVEIPAHAPPVWSHGFCQTHAAEYGEARDLVLRMKAPRLGRTSLYRVPDDGEVCRPDVQANFLRVSQQPAVQ